MIFISKMNQFEIPNTPEFQLDIPPRHKTEKTPLPRAGDTLLIWMNGRGLVGKAEVTFFEDGPPVTIGLQQFTRFPEPLLGDDWLRAADLTLGNIQTRLRKATTTQGGTRLLSADDERMIESAAQISVNP